MKFALSIVSFMLAAIAFLDGFITEYRQSRQRNATVPTMPRAVMAGIFVAFGLRFLPNRVPLWVLPLAFFGSTLLFGYAISKARK